MQASFWKKKLIPGSALFIGLLAAVLIQNLQHPGDTPQSPAETQTQTEPAPYQYLLRSDEQQLELFLLEAGQWEKIADFDLAIDDIPEADRRYLQAGLVIRDSEELQRALEDYLPSS